MKQRCDLIEKEVKLDFSEMEAEINVQSPEDK
jgi:hypothetical protein